MAVLSKGSWIWTEGSVPSRNAFVRFRRGFSYAGGDARIHITADSRYVLYVNGEYVGQGPVRAWPGHYRYDSYDIGPLLQAGRNVVAVLVNQFVEGNFQYIPAPPGLLAEIEVGGDFLPTDAGWRALPDKANTSITPRISIQEAFEEQFDARLDDGWTSLDYDDSSWPFAKVLRPALDGVHENLAPRDIPYLTLEPVAPKRLVKSDTVRSIPHIFTIHFREYLLPGERSSNMMACHAYAATQVWSPAELDMHAVWYSAGPFKVNGELVEGGALHLRAGWNSLAVQINGGHQTEVAFAFDGPADLRFCCTGNDAGPSWAIIGPFGLSGDARRHAEQGMDESVLIVDPADPAVEVGEEFWRTGDVASAVSEPWFHPVRPDHLPMTNVFVQAYTDRVAQTDVRVENADAILSGADWAVVHPDPDGADVRLLVDYGEEVVGYHQIELTASEGTIVDCHNFEFIQPDGRYNYAEGMNNSFRYVCREGRQTYKTLLRRGFRYSFVILRNMTSPVKIRRVEALFSTYPQTRRGSFVSSDVMLNRIWEVGAHTLQCCSEDTYTDCPTYEQTNWVGDARNEALIDWVINGDPRLWYRCLEQTGDSLDRSRITESNVPSAWVNILPAWSFLWMRSCREFFIYTGDEARSRKLLGFAERNIDGVLSYIDEQGLFSIRGWNMFDWAAMDTPNSGVITHQNCFAVLALTEAADMAEMLGEGALPVKWRAAATNLSASINQHLWSDKEQAYTDCLRGREQSPVFSQQTQTVAYLSGVAEGERAASCRDILYNPPDHFVKAGSPFYEFFLLEALQNENRVQEFLDIIRRDWGFMVEKGATTFWEMWSVVGEDGRLTRSHCHGWSAAPTFFLSTYVLGVKPGGAGFSPAVIEPHPGDLVWCRGVVPTPLGDVEVQWENNPNEPFVLRVKAPEGLALDIRLPRGGVVHR